MAAASVNASSTSSAAGGGTGMFVTAADQLQINKFARLHKVFMETKVNFNSGSVLPHGSFPMAKVINNENSRITECRYS